ncbi:MAG TPA: hypothetical protein VGK38_07430 [Prolixibacteraceae bacterium]|jgi:hypothetical protein
MKTSKIIFISLLSTIAILILATLIDLRISGRRNSERQFDFKVNKQIVPAFRVLQVYNSMNITLVKNDSSYIEVTYLKDSITPKVNYAMKGDTLIVTDFEKLVHRNVSIKISATDSLGRIQLNNSDISVERFGRGKLSFDMDQSNLSLNQDTLVKSSYQALDIVAKNHSRINSSEFRIDSLGLKLQNSEANLEIKTLKISGALSDSSKIYVRNPEEISIKKDGTSRINVNEY